MYVLRTSRGPSMRAGQAACPSGPRRRPPSRPINNTQMLPRSSIPPASTASPQRRSPAHFDREGALRSAEPPPRCVGLAKSTFKSAIPAVAPPSWALGVAPAHSPASGRSQHTASCSAWPSMEPHNTADAGGSIPVVEKLEHILTKLHATSQQAGSLSLQHILVQQSAADALQVRPLPCGARPASSSCPFASRPELPCPVTPAQPSCGVGERVLRIQGTTKLAPAGAIHTRTGQIFGVA